MGKNNIDAVNADKPNTKADTSVKNAESATKRRSPKKSGDTAGTKTAKKTGGLTEKKKSPTKKTSSGSAVQLEIQISDSPISTFPDTSATDEAPLSSTDIVSISEEPDSAKSSIHEVSDDTEQTSEPMPESEKESDNEENENDSLGDEPEAPNRAPLNDEEPPEISEYTIDALSFYDEKPRTSDDEDDAASRFDDFLAGYKKQISEMRKAKQSSDDEENEEAHDADDTQDNSDDLKIPFPSLVYTDEETDDEEDAVQLTIDISETPFAPLKESEKKEEKPEKKYSYNPKKPGLINNLFDIFEIFVFTVAIVLIVSSFFFRHSEVDGGSMDHTLSDGEHLIISDLFYTPKRGDIVVFEDYSLDKKIPIVKRVIGIEGDTVMVENENGVSVVYLNGEKLNESYTLTDDFDMHPSGEWTVGEGEVFVLGDHRNVSWDSRSFGTINAESILGKVVLRFYPFEGFGKVD